MVSFWAPGGVLVTLPTEEFLMVRDLAEATDSIVFWTGGYQNGWLPLLMPRPPAREPGN